MCSGLSFTYLVMLSGNSGVSGYILCWLGTHVRQDNTYKPFPVDIEYFGIRILYTGKVILSAS